MIAHFSPNLILTNNDEKIPVNVRGVIFLLRITFVWLARKHWEHIITFYSPVYEKMKADIFLEI